MIFSIFSLMLLTLAPASGKINTDFISQYFLQKNVNQLVTFACWDEYASFDYSQYFMTKGIRNSFNRIQNDLDMKKILKVNYYKIGVVLDLDCDEDFSVFDQFSAARLPFNESYNWMVVTTKSQIPFSNLDKLPLTVETELTMTLVQNSTYKLFDIYNFSYRHGGKLNVTTMGQWDRENGLKNELTQYKYKRRQDFQGLALNFSAVLFHKPVPDLVSYLTYPVDAHKDSLLRFHYILVIYLRDIYNITVNLKLDKTWGYLVNGSFNGILGDMTNGLVDISAAPFYYKSERIDVAEYTAESYYAELYFIFRNPRKNTVRNPFLKPFTPEVWRAASGLSLIFMIFLLISVKLEEYYQLKEEKSAYLNALTDATLITVAATTQQGSSKEVELYSGRIVFFMLFLWASMMFQFYSADIVSSLLTPPKKMINDVTDLANSDLTVGLENLPYNPDYFKYTTDPSHIYLREKKMMPPYKKKLYVDAHEGLKEVQKGGHAFYVDANTGYKIIEDTYSTADICDLSLSEIDLVSRRPLTIVTSKHSPFKKMVIYGIRQMVQHGLLKRMTTIWNHRKPNCPNSFRSRPVPVEIQEFSPAIILILCGLMFAFFVMVTEYLIGCLKRNKVFDASKSNEENIEA